MTPSPPPPWAPSLSFVQPYMTSEMNCQELSSLETNLHWQCRQHAIEYSFSADLPALEVALVQAMRHVGMAAPTGSAY